MVIRGNLIAGDDSITGMCSISKKKYLGSGLPTLGPVRMSLTANLQQCYKLNSPLPPLRILPQLCNHEELNMKISVSLALSCVFAFCMVLTTANAQTIYRPTNGSGYQNPPYAYDGNASTYAGGFVIGSNQNHVVSLVAFYQGFPAGKANPTSITLEVINSAQINADREQDGAVSLFYSTNNTSLGCGIAPDWHKIYVLQPPSGGGISSHSGTDKVTLPVTTNLTKVRVCGSVNIGGWSPVDPNDQASQLLYEIWIQET